MGRPRLIIVIRHAQSEGNRNRAIHQTVPDHRVKLTAEGWAQAEEAGRRLRDLLHPDDTLQFYTSPYRRTRETTEGILSSLTADDPSPSPFPRHSIKVFEEPRIREQDFGNFQPCSADMEKMWQQRASYGHFFFRIPQGESAADAYDRISGFNETLWRSFNDDEFPSVCVLVTHGLMTRVFLMRWFHWTVEYFEDLRNVNHCEFVTMRRSEDSGKYVLQNQLRTWSELKRRAAEERAAKGLPEPDKTDSAAATTPSTHKSGGTHEHDDGDLNQPARHASEHGQAAPPQQQPLPPSSSTAQPIQQHHPAAAVKFAIEEDSEAFPRTSPSLRTGRDFGGSESGFNTPADGLGAERADYGFPASEPGARADALGDQAGVDEGESDRGSGAGGSSGGGDDIAREEREDRSLRGSVY